MSSRDSILRRLVLRDSASTKDEKQDRITRGLIIERCRRDVVLWFNDWVWTYNPKQIEQPYIPFDLFPRQEEYLRWLEQHVKDGREGLVEKSRDVGITWLNMGFAVHRWLFKRGFKTTFGANKAEIVDTLGDPDSIFEKGRMLISALPKWMLPPNLAPDQHLLQRRFLNPANGNVIDGEAGDNMGRGGRSSMYFLDEAAFFDRAERADAATLATSNVRVWVSTPNGPGGLFARKRHSGHIEVFTFHFRDDPRKDEIWERDIRTRTEAHVFASEYDIDYTASVEGLVCPADWVASSRELSRRHPDFPKRGRPVAGLDVGAGRAESAFIAKWGPVVGSPITWKQPDTTETAYRALDAARDVVATSLFYDPVGVGAGVLSILKEDVDEDEGRKIPIQRRGINTGEPPTESVWPDGKTGKDKFTNLKAEMHWVLRGALQRAHERRLWEDGDALGVQHPLEDVILLPPGNDGQTLAVQLSAAKWFRDEKGKIKIESKEALAKRGVASPDQNDALILAIAAEMRRVDFKDDDYVMGPELDAVHAPFHENAPIEDVSIWDSGGTPWDM